jgi:ribosomal RNA-processing protein 36
VLKDARADDDTNMSTQSASDDSDHENAMAHHEDMSDTSSSNNEEGHEHDESAQNMLSHVSFGALSRAQAAIGTQGDRKRKRGDEMTSDQKSKLASMRERLQELRERKEQERDIRSQGNKQAGSNNEGIASFFTSGTGDNDDDNADPTDSSDDDSESTPSEEGGHRQKKRSSKHAPTAMPSNRAVGRYREVVEVPKIRSRDPRFDVTSGHLDRNSIQSRYSFLNDYQSNELTSLKKALKDPKAKLSEDQREKLKRKVISLESKLAANKAREREEKVRQEHRSKEREAVAQGKKPFYLKRSDVKKQALVERFEGMKSRQKDKVIQRRRKKMTAKERKNIPVARRT